MARSIQGTAFSGFESNDQTSKQRSEFASALARGRTSALGVSSDSVSDIFMHNDKPSPHDIMTSAIELMGSGFNVGLGQNPDFSEGFNRDALLFKAGDDKFEGISSVADKPSQLGPNITVPDMNSLPDDTTEPSDDLDTAVPPNSDGGFTNYGNAGFGIAIDRNNPTHTEDSIATYLERRGTNSSISAYISRSEGHEILGEYLDNSTYDYTE